MADTSTFPQSFNDPAYAAADQSASAAVGIPPGWLNNIRTKGEKSNADQVSEAGARTPYQITPDTRDSILKQTGVDPYLNPQNAAYGAAYLLKQNLDRYGNPILATAAYHGGTDQANWGPRTMAYVKRVTGASPNNPDATPSFAQADGNPYALQPAPTTESDQSGPSPLEQVYAAYKSGKMSADDATQFEQDVQAGHIVLPAGSTLNPKDTGNQAPGTIIETGPNGQEIGETPPSGAQQPQTAQAVPQSVVDAFNSGRMSPQDAQQFQADVKAGAIQLPSGANLQPVTPGVGRDLGVAARGYVQGIANSAGGVFDKAKGIIDAPVSALNALMQGGGASNVVDAIAGTHLTPQPANAPLTGAPQAAPAIPSVPATATEAMNRAGLPNAVTPTEHLIQAGAEGAGALTVPVPGVALKAIPAMVAAGAAGGTVGEAVHQATGSPMLGMAANMLTTVLSPAAASRVLGALAKEAPAEISAAARVEPTMAPAQVDNTPTGATVQPPTAAAEAVPVAAARAPAVADNASIPAQSPAAQGADATARPAQAASVSPSTTSSVAQTTASPVNPSASAITTAAQQFMSPEELASQARRAVGAEGALFGLGKNTARDVLASQGAPDADTLAAAQRLGVADNLQPDHLTSNQAYRELAQAIKSTPGSLARADEMQGLQQVAQRGMKIVEDAGGTNDLSDMSAQVKNDLMATQQQLDQKADALYKGIKADVPPTMPVETPNVLGFIQQRADDLGGAKNLSAIEKRVQAKLTPVEQPLTVNGAQVSASQLGMRPQMQQPTYALLDDVRRDIGAGLKNQGPFKDADSGLLKALYGRVSEDQRAALANSGVPDALPRFDAARAAVQMRKSVEDDMTSLFGKQLGDSVVGKLGTAMSSLSKGDESKFVNLVNAIPKSQRQQVTASGLGYAFGKATKNGDINFKSYADWMDGLKKNSGAFNAVMANLPADTRQQLLDLAKVSRGISNATRENITTGRLMAAREDLNAKADGLISSVVDRAKQAAVGGVVAGAAHVAGPIGAGLGHALISALSRGKPDVMDAADKLIVSPEFVALTKAPSPVSAPVLQKASDSSAMRRFFDLARAASGANDSAARQRWLLAALSSSQQQQQTNSKGQ